MPLLKRSTHLFSEAGPWPTFTPARPRGDTPTPTDPPAVDLANPAVVAAINAAKQQALQTATTAWETEKQAILTNKEAILGEKKKLEEALGGKKPEDIAAALKKLEEIENKAKAGEHGVDPEKYKLDVEQESQKKFQLWQKEQEALIAKNSERVAELEKENARLKTAEHRSWCAYQIAKAALPPDYRYIQEGAEEMVLDRIVPVMERHEVEGLPPVARFKVGGTLQTGSGPDGYMTEREFLDMARQGKLPGMPQLQFLFVSAGKGSNTSTPDTSSQAGTGGNWWKMSEDDKTKYVKEHGKQAAQDLMDRSPRGEASKAA